MAFFLVVEKKLDLKCLEKTRVAWLVEMCVRWNLETCVSHNREYVHHVTLLLLFCSICSFISLSLSGIARRAEKKSGERFLFDLSFFLWGVFLCTYSFFKPHFHKDWVFWLDVNVFVLAETSGLYRLLNSISNQSPAKRDTWWRELQSDPSNFFLVQISNRADREVFGSLWNSWRDKQTWAE